MRNVPDIFRLPSVMASDLEKSMICTQRACWERAQQLRPVVTLLSFSFLGIQVFYIYLLSFPPPTLPFCYKCLVSRNCSCLLLPFI